MRLVRVLTPILMLSAGGALSAQTKTEAAITANDVKARIAFLASDALRGRDTPSPGLEQAAAYIANEFKSYGLKPAGDSGTYLQRWDYLEKKLSATGARAQLSAGSWNSALTYLKDFFVIPGPAPVSVTGVYFAGTASQQPAALPADARGKVIAYYMPGKEAEGDWIKFVQAILPVAFSAQPAAVMLVLDPAFPAEQIAYLAEQATSTVLPVPLVGVRYDAAKEFFSRAGGDLEALKTAPAMQATATVAVSTQIEQQNHRPPNAVAILEGSDPTLKNEYIVFSAHMDHVGVGTPNAKGDSIYNGADDDASGTSAVLEVAQHFAAASVKPKRSLIFLLVSGEEKGLFGSAWFVQHPPVPANKIVANINIDMVGRNAPDTIVAIGREYTSLGQLAQDVAKSNASLKLTVAPDLWPEEQFFFRSDHFNFARANIPAIFFTTGDHADYHKPSDEPETINNDKVARVAQLVHLLGQAIANAADAPKWTAEGVAAMKAISGN